MRFVYLINCTYRSAEHATGNDLGQFVAIAFDTPQEAMDYCEFHTKPNEFYAWTRVQVGKFKKPRKKKA